MEKDRQIAFAVITGLSAAATTMATAAPCISWLDAGDLVTAAKTLGVPHPTGFPLFTVLGHAMTYLPVGNGASRIAVLSSISMGFACFCLALMAARHACSRLEALAAGAVLILLTIASPIVFLSARVPEVYGIHCALVASSIVCIDSLYLSGDQRWGYLLAVVIGLGLSNHALFRLCALIFLLFLLLYRPRLKLRFALTCAVLFLFALLTYLYLPVAAATEPAHNWGNPSSFGRFWSHINASSIRAAYREEMTPSLFRLGIHFNHYLRQLWYSLGPLLVLGIFALGASLASLHKLSRQRGYLRLGILTALLVAAETIYAVAINPMGLKDLQNGQFSILALGLVGTVFCVALARKAAQLTPRLRTPIRVIGIALPLVSLLGSLPHEYLNIGSDWTAEDIAVVHTSHATPDSMTVLVSDSMIAAHLYTQIAMDARPDMAIFGRNQVASGERFAYVARRQPYPVVDEKLLSSWEKSGGIISQDSFQERMHQLVAYHYGARAVYWEETVKLKDLADEYTTTFRWPIGQLFQNTPQKTPQLCGDPTWSFCSDQANRHLFASVKSDRKPSRYYRYWLAENFARRGKHNVTTGDFPQAATFFRRAIELAPEAAAWKTNLAVCFARMGKVREALDLTLAAIEQNPLSQVAIKNGLLYARDLRDQENLAQLERHLRRLQ